MSQTTYITRQEAAEELGITRQRIHALVKAGLLRPKIMYGRHLVLRSDVAKRKNGVRVSQGKGRTI